MSRIVRVNDEWLPEKDAKISVFDRGFLMADAVYEGTCVICGSLVDFSGHAARLRRSADEINLELPVDGEALRDLHIEIIRRNELKEGLVYIQVSRGVADRDFIFPSARTTPTLVMFTQAKDIIDNPAIWNGLSVITLPDLRWGRRDIKTVQLLYPSFAKTKAKLDGADDVWLVEGGFVTEASSANAHIVTKNDVLVTRELSRSLLPGITRASVLDICARIGIQVEERPFTPSEAQNAKEAFITSATNFVMPVVRVDGHRVGDGIPGNIAKLLRAEYIKVWVKAAKKA